MVYLLWVSLYKYLQRQGFVQRVILLDGLHAVSGIGRNGFSESACFHGISGKLHQQFHKTLLVVLVSSFKSFFPILLLYVSFDSLLVVPLPHKFIRVSLRASVSNFLVLNEIQYFLMGFGVFDLFGTLISSVELVSLDVGSHSFLVEAQVLVVDGCGLELVDFSEPFADDAYDILTPFPVVVHGQMDSSLPRFFANLLVGSVFLLNIQVSVNGSTEISLLFEQLSRSEQVIR